MNEDWENCDTGDYRGQMVGRSSSDSVPIKPNAHPTVSLRPGDWDRNGNDDRRRELTTRSTAETLKRLRLPYLLSTVFGLSSSNSNCLGLISGLSLGLSLGTLVGGRTTGLEVIARSYPVEAFPRDNRVHALCEIRFDRTASLTWLWGKMGARSINEVDEDEDGDQCSAQESYCHYRTIPEE
ncbi:hypothetical protein PRIPAC_77469 [Pristionchus pacificus]|uniref:Uncharacterized protein n=1 Tax=Pristionchus pacificus TaxID=54126 RepID=A0A2A6BYF8_PRIPA|nr:hypothetical protein PRIPAC_77469 [Pristionchus pacificus]|eukprot:PDM70857.1 hypothetical protein PRIPAC_45061 [Pristionchus pacificus]